MSDLIGDLEALQVPGANPPQKTCRIALILGELDEEQRAALAPLLEPESRVASARVAAVLTKWGHTVAYQTIQRHRRRKTRGSGCLCP